MTALSLIPAAAHGAVLALGLIIPIGPQNLYVFAGGARNRTGFAFLVAAAAATSDMLLIATGVLVGAVPALQHSALKWSLICGGVSFMIVAGWRSWKTPSQCVAEDDPMDSRRRYQVLGAFCASLINPHAIMDTVAVIGTASLNYGDSERIVFMSACMSVSWIWFIGLARFGQKFGNLPGVARHVGKLGAIAMWISAVLVAMALWQ